MRFRVTYGSPIRYFVDDREVSESEYRKAGRPHQARLKAAGASLDDALAQGRTARSQTTTCWPMKSDALSCHPNQIAAITERNKKHGITGVIYEADGTCVISDREARRKIMALEGVHDNEGGYGDDHGGQSPLYRQDSVPFADIGPDWRLGKGGERVFRD